MKLFSKHSFLSFGEKGRYLSAPAQGNCDDESLCNTFFDKTAIEKTSLDSVHQIKL